MSVDLNDHRVKYKGSLCADCASSLYYTAYKGKREAWEYGSDWSMSGGQLYYQNTPVGARDNSERWT